MTHGTPLSGGLWTPTRRAVVRGIAWATPTLTVAAAAPALAASPPSGEPTIEGVEPPFAALRCASVTAGTVTFIARVGDGYPEVGTHVVVTLPDGLAFADGSQEAAVEIGENGLVSVPSFRALGTAGDYAIAATFEGVTAYSIGTITPQPGAIIQLTRTPSSNASTPAITTSSVSITNGVKGSISGDDSSASSGSNAAVITADGMVRYWGRNVGAAAGSPGTLQYDGSNVTGMQHVDTWTSVASSNNSTGGVVAGSSGGSVYQWYRSGTGTGTPTVVKVNDISGTVLAAESNDGYSYVLTTSGLHYWQNATTGDSVSATLMSGTAGAVQLSTWSTRENQFTHGGGLVMPDGTIGTWRDNHDLKKSASAPQGVQSLIVTQTASYALTAGGVLSSEGSAFSTSPGGSGWTERESGVSSFSAWGVYQTAGGGTHYTGGAYVSVDGAVVAFGAISNASRAWTTTEKTFPADVSTSKVFGSDGMYLSLATNGDVYAWAGNVFAGDMTPQMKNPGQPASDLEVWGYHRTGAGEFYGGGYIISSPGACA